MTNPLIAARDAFADAMPETRVSLGGREWGYIDTGGGEETLILIPGTLGRGDIFWQQIEALRARLRIVAVTYPASGGVSEWSGDLAALMDRLSIARASVLGSSLGGYLVQYFAAVHPERVARLFAANTMSSTAGYETRMPYALDLDAVPVEELRAGFEQGLLAWGVSHPEQADLVELLLGEVGGRIPEAELRTRLKALKSAPDLPDVTLPRAARFTIEADDDPLIPPEKREGLREKLAPGVAYRFVTGGHFPYVARPQTYTALLEQAMGLEVTGPDWGTDEERTL